MRSEQQPLHLPGVLPSPTDVWAGNEPLQADLVERIQQLEQNQSRLEQLLRERDEWYADVLPESNDAVASLWDTPDVAAEDFFGTFAPGGRGFKLANTRYGDVNFSAWTYVRYLNRDGLDDRYTDAFGRTSTVDQRNDIPLRRAKKSANKTRSTLASLFKS